MNAATLSVTVKELQSYCGQLSSVFHQYALDAERIPGGFEGATNILDATAVTLGQVLSLLEDEAEGLKSDAGERLFSLEGIIYVQLLVSECAKSLAKIVPAIEDACLPRREFRAKAKRDKKHISKHGFPEIITSELKLDGKAFLEKVEITRWSLARSPIEECMERLYELQLHLLLVSQVVTVSTLSKVLSTGKVDIKSIVTYHDRILRTAHLVGIDIPKLSKASRRTPRYDYSSSSDSFSGSDSDVESDDGSVSSMKRKKKTIHRGPPCPPPPPPVRFDPPLKPLELHAPQISVPPMDAKPPSYSESHKSPTNSSTLLGTASQNTSVKSQPESSEYSDEKKGTKTEPAPLSDIPKPVIHAPHLFKRKSDMFRFRLKSIFGNKESLAAEMRQALCNADSQLLAFVIQRHDIRQVPHSAFHTLEATHMKTILSQLNDNAWYHTFTTLDQPEHTALTRVLYPFADGKVHERQMVALKTVKNEMKLIAWTALLKELLNKPPFISPSGGRVLLAIVREKLVDGKSIIPPHRANMFPPPPPPPMLPPTVPAIKPPPLPCADGRTRIQDLSSPAPPPPPPVVTPPPNILYSPPPPPGSRVRSPLSEIDAAVALTSYHEYTIRQATPIRLPGPPPPPGAIGPHIRSWRRVEVTYEINERNFILERVQRFQRGGGNAIEAKLRLTEDQNGQVNRLMDELRSAERDHMRFEWSWAEISLHGAAGEITNFVTKEGQPNPASSTTLIHAIAKRSARPHLSQLGVYNFLTRNGGGGPPPPRAGPPPPPGLTSNGCASSIRERRRSKYVNSDSDSDSGSDSDSTIYSSDSSIGQVRRRLRRYRVKQNRKTAKTKRRSRDSGSDSTSDFDSEDEDIIKLNVELKKGDDVVKKLLDMWTPQEEVKGKGKAIE